MTKLSPCTFLSVQPSTQLIQAIDLSVWEHTIPTFEKKNYIIIKPSITISREKNAFAPSKLCVNNFYLIFVVLVMKTPDFTTEVTCFSPVAIKSFWKVQVSDVHCTQCGQVGSYQSNCMDEKLSMFQHCTVCNYFHIQNT